MYNETSIRDDEFWKDLKTFLQFVESSTKDSPLFNTHACLAGSPTATPPPAPAPAPILSMHMRIPVPNYDFSEWFEQESRLKMIEQNCENGQFEKGRNLYVWNLLTKGKYFRLSFGRYAFREGISDYDKFKAVENYDKLFTDKKRGLLELIAKLVTGCLYYSIKDFVSQGKNVMFAISTKEATCKQLIDLIFINNNMIKKLLNCARIIPHCNLINWYEKGNTTLIISQPDFLGNSNKQDVTLLKLSIYDRYFHFKLT